MAYKPPTPADVARVLAKAQKPTPMPNSPARRKLPKLPAGAWTGTPYKKNP